MAKSAPVDGRPVQDTDMFMRFLPRIREACDAVNHHGRRADDDRVFKNTFKDIAYVLEACSDNGTRFELE